MLRYRLQLSIRGDIKDSLTVDWIARGSSWSYLLPEPIITDLDLYKISTPEFKTKVETLVKENFKSWGNINLYAKVVSTDPQPWLCLKSIWLGTVNFQSSIEHNETIPRETSAQRRERIGEATRPLTSEQNRANEIRRLKVEAYTREDLTTEERIEMFSKIRAMELE